MKRTIKLLMVLFMFMLIPNILKAAEVSIENITLVEHSDLLSEKTPASANGLNVNFDVSFTMLDDFAKYKVIINNPTNTEYEVQQETDFTSSDHIVYTYSYEGDSKILKANSKLVMYITLTYKYEVQPNELTDGKFVEKNKLTVNLSNGTENPKTADASTVVLFALMLMLIGAIGLYKYTNRKEFLGTLVALAIVFSLSVPSLTNLVVLSSFPSLMLALTYCFGRVLLCKVSKFISTVTGVLQLLVISNLYGTPCNPLSSDIG